MTTIQNAGAAGQAPKRSIYELITKPFHQLIAVMNSIGTIAVFLMMFLICADVLRRSSDEFPFNYITNFLSLFMNTDWAGQPIRGTNEIIGFTIIVAVFLQVAHSLHVGRFARAEMFIEPLKKRRPIMGAIYEALFACGGVYVGYLIAYGTWDKLEKSYLRDTFFGVQGDFILIEWPMRAIIFGGSVALAITYGLIAIKKLMLARKYLAERARTVDKTAIGLRSLYVLAIFVAALVAVIYGDFSKVTVGMLSLLGVLAVIFLGLHIGIGLILIGFAGIWIMMGTPKIGINTVKLASNTFLHSEFFGVVPLFVLMGLLINESGIGKDTFDVARWALGRIKGGLGIATVVANAIFAAITGSSIASAAVFTKVATPHMLAHGYTAKFAVGTVAGSSVLGMLIPPSLLLIVYALVSEQSVGALFIAAIIPGIILATAMCIAIVCMSIFWPKYVGVPDKEDIIEENVGSAILKILPILILVAAVMGGIYGGFYTAVEAGAIGAAGALIIALLKRRLTPRKLWNVLIETGHTTVSVLFLILAANIYGIMLSLSGFPQAVGQIAIDANLGFLGFMAVYVIALIILGMFLDSISMMLIVLPLVLPIIPEITNFSNSLIWFGIVTVIAVEMGLLTPPLGIAVYVVRSTIDDASITLGQIFAGAFPYVIIMLLVTVLLIAIPEISLIFMKTPGS